MLGNRDRSHAHRVGCWPPLEKPGTDPDAENELARNRIAAIFAKFPPVSALFLSHAHQDHTGLLDLVPDSVPVYCSEGTSMMMKAGSTYARQCDVPPRRKRILQERKAERIGDLLVTGHPVDHSVFGSLALEIEADGQRVLYTGDFRLHGRKPGMAKALLAALSGKPLDALLIEGTHISSHRTGPTEEELEKLILADIRSAPGLVVASFSPPHIDRFVGFYKATRDAGRVLAVDHYAGFVLHLAAKIAAVPRPISGNNIVVFRPQWQKRICKVERCFWGTQVATDVILSEPRRYVMLFRPNMLDGDFPEGLPKGVRCLYSFWSGYLDRDNWRSARSAIALAGGDLIERHTSGHVFREDLVRFVKKVDYRLLIPIHTDTPDEFKRLFRGVRVLADAEGLDLEQQISVDR